MRKIFIIILALVSLNSNAQRFLYHQLKNGASGVVVSNDKNVQFVNQDSIYDAFGFIDTIRVNRASYYRRIGRTHVLGGQIYYTEYNITAGHWYDTVCIDRDTVDARDSWGGDMGDSVILFCLRYNHKLTQAGAAAPLIAYNFILKGDSNNHFTSRLPFTIPAGYPELQIKYAFGHIQKGDSPGEYYEAVIQTNVDTGSARIRVECMHTTDYFRTYTMTNIYDGSFGFSECALAYLGDGKLVALMRQDNGGAIYVYRSLNSGSTWTARGNSNLGWYLAGGEMIPFARIKNGKLDIFYQDRDSRFVAMSLQNDTANFLNTTNPVTFNDPKLFYYNISENWQSANDALGYVSTIPIVGDSIDLVVFSHETNANRANMMATRVNFSTPATSLPLAPPNIDSSLITTTSFRVDILGYTNAELENIDYFQFDLSTDPAFESFVTAKYRAPSAYAASVLQNVKMFGLWDIYNVLTTATTYYLRIRACNSFGCSSYTTITVTTL